MIERTIFYAWSKINIAKKCSNRFFDVLCKPIQGVEMFESVFSFFIGALVAEIWLDGEKDIYRRSSRIFHDLQEDK